MMNAQPAQRNQMIPHGIEPEAIRGAPTMHHE